MADPKKEEKVVHYTQYESTLIPSSVIHFYISDSINDPKNYVDMIHRIKTASPNDIIYIYLNTPGGRLDTGIQIINAMRASAAHIVTVLEGEVCSLGTLIFLSGDEFTVHDNCMFMIHNFSSGTHGKGNEQLARIESTVRWFKKLAKDTYIPFLSEEELDEVLEGKDMWMDSDEVRKRLKKMVKLMQDAMDEAEAKKAARNTKKKKKTESVST
jgi:ATP-dependent protease ClpP protease subunit